MTGTTAPAASRRPLPLLRGRLLVFTALVLSAFTLRAAVTSVTPLFPRVGDDLGFGTAAIGVLGMLPTAMFALFGVLTPWIATRWGLERTALLAAVLTAVGVLSRALAPEVVSLAGLSAVALAGMGIGNVVIPPLVKRYFSDRLAVMSTLYICVLQLGTIVPALIAVPVADASGWRVSLGLWAIAAVAAAGPWSAVLLLRRTRSATASEADTSSIGETVTTADRAPTLPPVWRTSLGWGMAFMFGMTSMITYSLFTWLPTLLVESGVDETTAGTAVAVFAAMGLFAALLAPALANRMTDPYPLVLLAAATYLAGFAGLLWLPTTATFVWVILVGIGPLTFPLSLTLINLRTRTPAGSSSLSGFTQGVGYTVACAGPLLFGVLHESTDGWTWSFGFLLVGVAVLLWAARSACRPQIYEDL